MDVVRIVVGVLFFTFALFLAVGIAQTIMGARNPLLSRLEVYAERKSALERTVRRPPETEQQRRRRRRRRRTFLPRISSFLSHQRLGQWLEEELKKAHSSWYASEVVMATAGASAFLFLIALVATKANFALSIPALLVPPVFAFWLIKFSQRQWLRRFDAQFADALLLMANTLRAGFSLLQAFEMAAREAMPPISDELERVIQEVQTGVPIEEALRNLARRVPTQDMEIFVTAVLIQREVGGNLAEILETIARMIGERQRVQREVRTLSAQGRFSGMILAFLPAFAATALQLLMGSRFTYFYPDGRTIDNVSYFYPLLHDPLGRIVLVVVVILYIAGFVVIRRVSTVEV